MFAAVFRFLLIFSPMFFETMFLDPCRCFPETDVFHTAWNTTYSLNKHDFHALLAREHFFSSGSVLPKTLPKRECFGSALRERERGGGSASLQPRDRSTLVMLKWPRDIPLTMRNIGSSGHVELTGWICLYIDGPCWIGLRCLHNLLPIPCPQDDLAWPSS